MFILASDYDGTLNLGGSVSETDKAAIDKWRKAGNLFGIVSGRGYPSIRAEADYYHINCDFFICNNGSLVYGVGDEPEDEIAADGEVLRSLVSMIMEAGGWHAAISHASDRYMVKIENGRGRDPKENWVTVEELSGIPRFNQLDTRFETDREAKKFAERVNRRFGQSVTAFQNSVCVDIIPAGVDKAGGLLRYGALKNVSKENTLVLGDNYNDLSMILEFNGFTVSSGKPEVIAQSRRAYDSIAGLIEDFLK